MPTLTLRLAALGSLLTLIACTATNPTGTSVKRGAPANGSVSPKVQPTAMQSGSDGRLPAPGESALASVAPSLSPATEPTPLSSSATPGTGSPLPPTASPLLTAYDEVVWGQVSTWYTPPNVQAFPTPAAIIDNSVLIGVTIVSTGLPGIMALDSRGDLYVGEGTQLVHYNSQGVRTIVDDLRDTSGATVTLKSIGGLFIDAQDQIWLNDSSSIWRMGPDHVMSTVTSGLKMASDLVRDNNGNLFVIQDTYILKLAPDGKKSCIGGVNRSGYADGPAAGASFSMPRDLSLAPSGDIFISDYGNHRIRKLSKNGSVSTVAGWNMGFADGVGWEARFNAPSGIATQAGNTVYVCDSNNNCIRRVNARGGVVTVAGTYDVGLQDATGPAARFFLPNACVAAPDGTLFVRQDSGIIRKITF